MKFLIVLAPSLFASFLLVSSASAQDLGTQAVQILAKNCRGCHGAAGAKEGGVDYVVNTERLISGKKVVPGKPEQSPLYLRLTSKDDPMPPEDEQPRPSTADIALIKKWIEAGAPAPKAPLAKPRTFVSRKDILAAVDKHLNGIQEEDRRYQRYFSLTHLHNLRKPGSTEPAVTDSEFRLYRAALSKLVNSLSWKPDIVLPKPVDAHRTIFAIDLRDLDWDKGSLWKEILRNYPYALRYDRLTEDEKLRDVAKRINTLTQSDVPIVRADWFLGNASLPPLYHILLQIPKTSLELERTLNVDLRANFRRNRLRRAGFAKSGVSAQNRLVERHSASYGAYWISYDFKPRKSRGSLFRYPLGPKFAGNRYLRHAFEHDGGEIIFNLPNGLQGYMLIDEKGNRIDKGPADVVRDAQQRIGSPEIINGVSCMACHRHGMIEFTDTVRTGTSLFGDAKRKVQLLYTEPETMKKQVAKDRRRFLTSLDEAIGPYLRFGDRKNADVKEFGEPVAKIARWYLRAELGAEEIAAELGIQDPQHLVTAIKFSSRLRGLGLAPIAAGNTIKREAWEEMRGTCAGPATFALYRGCRKWPLFS